MNYLKSNDWCHMLLILFIMQIMLCISCKKLVDIKAPVTSLNGRNVYSNDATAAAVFNGIYSSMSDGLSGIGGLSMQIGLSSDELTLWPGGFDGGTLQQLYQNNLNAQQPLYVWQGFYNLLLTVNSAIEELQKTTVTPAVKEQLLGEGKFLRAFFHFYLVNLYGDVPLALTSDWRVNGSKGRTPKSEVYEQIIADLKDAQALLADDYLDGTASKTTTERTRPNKSTATALLARVYLYNKEWVNADVQATAVINSSLYGLNSLNEVFNKNNIEAIWQLQFVNIDYNTEGFHFILTQDPGSDQPTYLNSFLLNAFEIGDNRLSNWVDIYTNGVDTFYYPNKYTEQFNPNNKEYLMVLRLAEQYLIRAEARAHQNKISEAKIDLDAVRNRAGLSMTTANDKASLLEAILRERQVELFTEWGHRWFDLKRTEKIDAIMGSPGGVCAAKGGVWNTNWQLFPLPFDDIRLNPKLAPNNPGY